MVLEVAERANTEAANIVTSALSLKKRTKVKALATDMSQAMAAAVHSEIPQAELVHDKFQASKLPRKAVDKVRQAEAK